MQIERIGTHRGTVITEKSNELFMFLSNQPVSEHWQPFEWDRQTFEARTDGKYLFVRAEWKRYVPEMVLIFNKNHELTIYVPQKTWCERVAGFSVWCALILPLTAVMLLFASAFYLSTGRTWRIVCIIAAGIIWVLWTLVHDTHWAVF